MYGEIHENLWKLLVCLRGAVVTSLINIGWSVRLTNPLASLLILSGPWNRLRKFEIKQMDPAMSRQKASIFWIAVAGWGLAVLPPQVISSIAEMSWPHCHLKVIQVCLVHLTLVTVQVGLCFLFASEGSQCYSFYFVVESHTKLGYFGALTEMLKNVRWVLLSDIFRASYQQAAVVQYTWRVCTLWMGLVHLQPPNRHMSFMLHGWNG